MEREQAGVKNTDNKDEKPKQGQVSFKDAVDKKAKELNMSTRELESRMTQIDLNRNKVTWNQTLGQILGLEDSKAYVVQLSETDWRLLAVDENGNLYEFAERTETRGGVNNRGRTSFEGERGLSQGSLQETQYLAEFSIKGRDGKQEKIAVQREGTGSAAHIQVLYGRTRPERGINDEDNTTYVSVANDSGLDRTQSDPEIRNQMSRENTPSPRDHREAEIKDRLDAVHEDRIDWDQNGIQVDEYDIYTCIEKFAENEKLYLERQGIDFPGQAEVFAKKIAYEVLMKGDNIDNAERKVMDREGQKGGITPGNKGREIE